MISFFMFRMFNGKELTSNYKHNITTRIIYNNENNELNKISQLQTRLIINSINSNDYGIYACKASNIIGDTTEFIKVQSKRKC